VRNSGAQRVLDCRRRIRERGAACRIESVDRLEQFEIDVREQFVLRQVTRCSVKPDQGQWTSLHEIDNRRQAREVAVRLISRHQRFDLRGVAMSGGRAISAVLHPGSTLFGGHGCYHV